MTGFNMKVTPEIEQLTEMCKDHSSIDLSLYGKYDVKRGLRDINGKGVLAGLTQVSNVQAVKVVDGKEVPCAGSLYYRGYNIKDLTAGFVKDDRFGFEETTYLLLFGVLPDKKQLEEFKQLLSEILAEGQIYMERLFPYSEAGQIQLIREYGQLLSEEYTEGGIAVKARVPREIYPKVT